MVGALTDPFDDCHMGITAENVADKWGISREDQDELAVESHQRAAQAIAEGLLQGADPAHRDQGPQGHRRPSTPTSTSGPTSTIGGLAKLRPVFEQGAASVTAGNAAGINDAAAAVVLMRRRGGRARRAASRWAGWSPTPTPGSSPKYMGIGPVPAVRGGAGEGRPQGRRHRRDRAQRGVRRPGAGRDPRPRACPRTAPTPTARGISLGHPIGATGCILTVKALYELQRTGGRYALVTMCIGGGQGIAAIFERAA